MNEAGGHDPLSCMVVAGSGEVIAFGAHDGGIITVRACYDTDDDCLYKIDRPTMISPPPIYPCYSGPTTPTPP